MFVFCFTAARPPPIRDERKWKALCYGADAGKKSRAAAASPAPSSPNPLVTSADAPVAAPALAPAQGAEQSVGPLLSLILPLDELSTNTLLSLHVTWACKRPLARTNTAWLFALLCRVEKPLDADLAASLRQLLRRCVEARAALAQPDADISLLPALNILITIVALYFGQQQDDEES